MQQQRFPGLTCYFRKFASGYASVGNDMLRRKNFRNFDPVEGAFENFKEDRLMNVLCKYLDGAQKRKYIRIA